MVYDAYMRIPDEGIEFVMNRSYRCRDANQQLAMAAVREARRAVGLSTVAIDEEMNIYKNALTYAHIHRQMCVCVCTHVHLFIYVHIAI